MSRDSCQLCRATSHHGAHPDGVNPADPGISSPTTMWAELLAAKRWASPTPARSAGMPGATSPREFAALRRRGLPGPALPSLPPVATAIPTAADTMRSWSAGGSSDAPTVVASDMRRDGMGRRREHPVADPVRTCATVTPKPEAGEDERVVGLRDLVSATFDGSLVRTDYPSR